MNSTTTTPAIAITTTSLAAATPEAAHVFHAAYNATTADRAYLPTSELLPVNLDVQIVTTTILGALPRIWSLRDELVSKVPSFDIAQFDKLEVYAKALAYAQTVYLAASTTTEALPALAGRAMEVRKQLVTDARALASRGFVDAKRLDDLKGGTGYLAVASDLGVLVRMLRERWSEVASKSAIQSAELDEAEQLFERITLAYAERTRQSAVTISAAEDRQRAYTLLLKAYDQARGAATFLRWSTDDADTFTPSLWAGRGTRNHVGADVAASNANAQPAPAPSGAPAVEPPAADPQPAPSEPGLPGSSPFVH